MAGVYKGLNVKISADSTSLSKELNRIDTQTRGLKRNMSAINKALKLDPGNSELVRQKMKAYADEIKSTKERLDTLKKAESQIGKDGMSTEAWETLQREIASTEGKLRNLVREYREFAAANSALGRAGAALTEIGEKLDPIGRKMQSVGRTMTTHVTLPIIAAATASVKAAVDIDTALTDVRKTVDGTEEDYAALKDAAIEFSKTNAVSAADLLSIESLGAQLGYTLDVMENGKTQVQEFGEVVSGMAIATNMSAEQAGQELAQFFNIMQESKEHTSNYASAIVGLGNSFATTESDISAMAMRIAGAGKTIGLSSADVLGLAAALTSLGIEAEAGGTAISTVMSNIDKDVALGNENLQTWAETAHMSAEQFAEAWRSSPVEALEAVLKGMNENVDAGGNLSAMLDELGISSLRQTDMMKRLANSGDLMSEAVARANKDWQENVALSNEVANRNGSLAAKFEMLRNRVTAVAEEIGRPLADALLDAIDAAEPLFEAIETGARAFSDMSEDEQRAVVQTVAIIAALGPALSLFGKVTSSVKVLGGGLSALARFLAAVDMATGGAKDGMTQVANAAGEMETKVKSASVAMGALKTTAILLAVAALVELGKAYMEAYEDAKRHQDAITALSGATGSLKSPADALAASMDGQSAAMGRAAASAKDYAKAVDEAEQRSIDLASSIKDTFSKADQDAASLQYYSQKIQDLAGNCHGSAEKLAELQGALDAYNSLAGTSYAVVDGFSGRINAQTGEIQANTEAVIMNAYVKASQESLEAAVGELQHTNQMIDETQARVDALQAQVDNAQVDYVAAADFFGAEGGGFAATQEFKQLNGELEQEKRNLADLKALASEQEASVKNLTEWNKEAREQANQLVKEITGLAVTTEDYASALARVNDVSFDEVAAKCGKSTDELAAKLRGAGISAENFAKIGGEAFARLYDDADTNLSRVQDAINLVDELGIDPKVLDVNDEGVLTAQGHVIDLNEFTIDGKSFTVDDDGTINVEGQRIEGLIADINRVPTEHQTRFSAYDDGATSVAQRVSNWINSVPRYVSTVFSALGIGGMATGGLTPEPIRRIPRHADGGLMGFVTGPILTNRGFIGEDGTEFVGDFGGGSQVVPVENTRYVRPLARSIVKEMASSIQPRGGDTYNITVHASGDGDDIARSVTRAIRAQNLMKGRR